MSKRDDEEAHAAGLHSETKMFGCPECFPATSGSPSAIRAREEESDRLLPPGVPGNGVSQVVSAFSRRRR